MTRRILSVIYSAITVSALAGCSAAGETVMQDVDPFGWDEAAVIEYDNRDTVSLYDLSLTVRYGIELKVNQLPLTITTVAPDSAYVSEPSVFFLKYDAKPASTAAVEQTAYRRSARLSQLGIYKIIIEPRVPLRGVEAVGITFEKRGETWEKTN